MGLFKSRTEIAKREIVGALHGTPVLTPPGHTVVVNEIGGWSVIFDVDSPEEGPPPIFFGPRKVTRIGIPFTARDGFVWDLKRRRLVGDKIYERRRKWTDPGGTSWEQEFDRIQAQLKPPPIPFGFGDFDYEFTIETNDEARLHELFEPRAFRDLVQEQPTIRLKTEQDEKGWMASLVPELRQGVAALFFQDRLLLRDAADVQSVHTLLSAAIERLVAIGSADARPPRIF